MHHKLVCGDEAAVNDNGGVYLFLFPGMYELWHLGILLKNVMNYTLGDYKGDVTSIRINKSP